MPAAGTAAGTISRSRAGAKTAPATTGAHSAIIRALPSGEFWSAAYQPALQPSDSYEAIFSDARAEFRRRDRGFDTHTEIAVSPEDDIELRRITITNTSRSRKTIEVTSYAEVVLASAAADALHPAFSNLFVQTEILREQQAILCTRRPRSREEHPPWMCHLMAVHGAEAEEASYETDRMRFIGRGNTVANPQAMTAGRPGSPTARARCWIRSWRSAGRSRWMAANRSRWIS